MMMLLSEETVRGKKDRPWSTYVDVSVLASQVLFCVAGFWHSCLSGAFIVCINSDNFTNYRKLLKGLNLIDSNFLLRFDHVSVGVT